MPTMTRMGIVVALATIAGCYSSSTLPCAGADGVAVLCPADTRCVQVGSSATCAKSGESVCGDGVQGSDETCDDGNTLAGDGCSADCDSDETCGNGVVDAVRGEACDDGNPFAHDGCDSSCASELPHWIQLTNNRPAGRQGAVMAYDVRHDQVVMFGGIDTGLHVVYGDTWLWNEQWQQVLPLKSPSPRSLAALANAGNDGGTYLFGGIDAAGSPLADLWRWTGSQWEHLELAPSAVQPSARYGAAMVYDAHRQVLVMFGGTAASGASVAETWELDVATLTWALRLPTASPPDREDHGMAYDPIHGYVLMFGGSAFPPFAEGIGTSLADTWTYDGATWTDVTTAGMPVSATARIGFDGGEMVLTTAGAKAANYRWSGTAWSAVATATVTRIDPALTFVSPRLLMFGGAPDLSGTFKGPSDELDAWPRVDSEWRDTAAASVPRTAEAAVLDLALGVPIMFGGTIAASAPAPTGPGVGSDVTIELMTLGSGAWTPLVTSTTAPTARGGLAAAYDEVGRETVFFGGALAAGDVDTNETWSWRHDRASEWQQETPARAPTPRRDTAMAYDADRGLVVLFGGVSAAGVNAETWHWDRAARSWVEDAPSAIPPRAGAGLAYDRVHHQLVLFGGRGVSAARLADTWLLTVDGWTQAPQAAGPTPEARVGAAMAWDPARQRIVMFGGETTIAEQDAWEWDGARWTQIATPPPPPRVRGVLLGSADGLLLYGGAPTFEATTGQLSDVWLLRYDGSHAGQTCRGDTDDDGDGLAGCADPDCWLACRPLCLPGDACSPPPAGPVCGDGSCSPVETIGLCPTDCTVAVCGDGICTMPGDCPGDCPP